MSPTKQATSPMFIRFDLLHTISVKHRHQTIVLTEGCYDLLHVGHVAFLEQCKKLGDILVVAVPSDARVREKKGINRPIIPDTERVTMLVALSAVDYATIAPGPTLDGETPSVRLVKMLKPNVFVTSEKRFQEHRESLRAMEVQVKPLPEVRLTSTTSIIDRIRSR